MHSIFLFVYGLRAVVVAVATVFVVFPIQTDTEDSISAAAQYVCTLFDVLKMCFEEEKEGEGQKKSNLLSDGYSVHTHVSTVARRCAITCFPAVALKIVFVVFQFFFYFDYRFIFHRKNI